MKLTVFLFTLLLVLAMAFAAQAYEEPSYTVIEAAEGYELRRYEPYLVAETVVRAEDFAASGNVAFRRLAGYIFGGNRSRDGQGEPVKMSMTVPVTRHRPGQADDNIVYRFVMERAYTLDTLPVPDDGSVRLVEVPGGLVAALTYSGRTTDENYVEQLAQLRRSLARDGIAELGEPPVSAVYNGPWTLPFLRRNEVLIRVAPAG